jgi:sRNA-binding carbon storage regulator CsrA
MLCLGRTEGERVFIPELGVTVVLLQQDDGHGQTRIGFETPPGVIVIREEIATREQIKELRKKESGR